jgi:hypothetical protein
MKQNRKQKEKEPEQKKRERQLLGRPEKDQPNSHRADPQPSSSLFLFF